MLNGETEQKQSVHFFALMLALSLCTVSYAYGIVYFLLLYWCNNFIRV
mgnify:CR=1 FL=1